MPHCWLLQGQVSWNTQTRWIMDDQAARAIVQMLCLSPMGNLSSVRCAAELPEPSGPQPAEVLACCSAARRPVDGSLWSWEQTLDDSCVFHTSPNVGSASKWICFQSLLPFSALVPRLKYIMARLMMKGWFCSSGRGGEMKEGLRRLSAALREDHYGEERGCRRCFSHTSHFHSTENANGLKHIHTSCSILITQILLHLTQTRDCFLCWRVTSAGFLTRVQMNVCKLKVKLRLSLTLQ